MDFKRSRSDVVVTFCFLLILGVALGTSAKRIGGKSATTQPTSKPAATQPVTTAPARATSLEQAVEQSRQTHKPIYLEFSAEWCTFRKKYEAEVLNTPAGREALGQVVYLQLDFDAQRPLAEKFGITGIPTGLLLNLQGDRLKVIDRHVGALTIEELREFLGERK